MPDTEIYMSSPALAAAPTPGAPWYGIYSAPNGSGTATSDGTTTRINVDPLEAGGGVAVLHGAICIRGSEWALITAVDPSAAWVEFWPALASATEAGDSWEAYPEYYTSGVCKYGSTASKILGNYGSDAPQTGDYLITGGMMGSVQVEPAETAGQDVAGYRDRSLPVCAIKETTVWGTAVTCGAGSVIPILAGSGHEERRSFSPDDEAGTEQSVEGRYSDSEIATSHAAYLRYEGFDPLLLSCLRNLTQSLAAGVYTHSMKLYDAGKASAYRGAPRECYITSVLYDGYSVDEVPSLQVSAFEISGSVGRPLQVSFSGLGSGREWVSSVNTPYSLQFVTKRTSGQAGKRVLYSEGVFQFDGSAVYPQAFKLSVDRRLMVSRELGGTAASVPHQDNPPVVTLSMDFGGGSDYSKLPAECQAGFEKLVAITFAPATGYYFQINMERARITSVAENVKYGRTSYTVEFQGLNWLAFVNALSIVTKNTFAF